MITHSVAQHRWRRPLVLVGVGFVVLAVTVGLTVMLTRSGGDRVGGGVASSPPASAAGSPSASVQPSPSPSRPTTVGTWRNLAAVQVPASYYTGVWTGTDLLVYTPYTPEGKGTFAAYNPARN